MLAVFRDQVQGFGLVGQGVPDVGHDAFEDLVAAGAGDGGVEAGIEHHPGFGVGFHGHRGHHGAEDIQVLGSAAFGGEAGGGDFDVRPGLGEVAGGELAEDQVVRHVVGDDEGAPAGAGHCQAQGGAGAEGLADHGAADTVLLREGNLGVELGADGETAAFDVAADGVEDRLGGAEAGKRGGKSSALLSGCPAV